MSANEFGCSKHMHNGQLFNVVSFDDLGVQIVHIDCMVNLKMIELYNVNDELPCS